MEDSITREVAKPTISFYSQGPDGFLKIVKARVYESVAAFSRRGELTPYAGRTIALEQYESIEALPQTLLLSLADVYAKIFAAAPWFEIGRCFECGTFYREIGIECIKDGNLVTCAYPLDWTMEYIKKELSKKGARLLLSLYPGESSVLSFAWGYELRISDFAISKYEQDQDFALAIEKLLCTNLTLKPSDKIFLISEVGTLPELRGIGISSISCGALASYAQDNHLPVVTRTIVDPPSIWGIANRLGFIQISGPVRGSGKVIGPLDSINPNRVLFCLNPAEAIEGKEMRCNNI